MPMPINRPISYLMTPSASLPVEQGTNLAAARIIDHAGTSNAPAPVHPVRSGRSNLQRFIASMNCIGGGESVNREESLDNDVSSPEGVEKYKASVLAWAFNKKHSSSVMDRTHAMQRIIDEIGDRKDGCTTDHVARKYLGSTGKIDNGIVVVKVFAKTEFEGRAQGQNLIKL